MPPDLDASAPAASSPAADAPVVSSTSAPVSTPEPSPAQPAETQASASPGETQASTPDAPTDDRAGLLAAVRKAVEAAPKNSGSEGTAAAPGQTQKPGDPAANPNATPDPTATPDPLESDPTEDEVKGYAPRTKARIDKLLSQRNGFRTEVESLKPAADQWNKFDGYLKNADLAPEDVNLLLGAGAQLRKGNFKAFLDGVMPYVELCRQNLGLALPPDLTGQVENGEISEAAARELSTTRLANARLAGEAQARQAAEAEARRLEAQAAAANTVASAVTVWEQGIKAKDPDYAKKAPVVERFAQALIAQHGVPRTADEGVRLANAAYEEVNRTFAAARPAPVPTQPVPVGARAVNSARTEPATLMEAARLGLERSRRA